MTMQAGLDEAEEVLGLALVAVHEAPASHHPGKEPFDVPAAPVAAQLPEVLRLPFSARVVRRDHLHAHPRELSVEWIAVVRCVADQFLGELLEEARVQCCDDELLLIVLTTRNPNGDRKARAVCRCHDLGRFAAASSSNQRAPSFAPAWEPST
jgi:hypothetical protein